MRVIFVPMLLTCGHVVTDINWNDRDSDLELNAVQLWTCYRVKTQSRPILLEARWFGDLRSNSFKLQCATLLLAWVVPEAWSVIYLMLFGWVRVTNIRTCSRAVLGHLKWFTGAPCAAKRWIIAFLSLVTSNFAGRSHWWLPFFSQLHPYLSAHMCMCITIVSENNMNTAIS